MYVLVLRLSTAVKTRAQCQEQSDKAGLARLVGGCGARILEFFFGGADDNHQEERQHEEHSREERYVAPQLHPIAQAIVVEEVAHRYRGISGGTKRRGA